MTKIQAAIDGLLVFASFLDFVFALGGSVMMELSLVGMEKLDCPSFAIRGEAKFLVLGVRAEGTTPFHMVGSRSCINRSVMNKKTTHARSITRRATEASLVPARGDM